MRQEVGAGGCHTIARMRTKALALLLASLVVVGCASSSPQTVSRTRTEYNLGVDSYVAKDYAAARVHWARAVDIPSDDQVHALNNLGFLLYQGWGGAPDVDRAIVLWKQAASQGHSESQWHLGHAHESGRGVPKSLVEAYAWYRCSIESAETMASGDKDAEAQILSDSQDALTKLLTHLSAEDFAAGEVLAKEYVERFAKRGRT